MQVISLQDVKNITIISNKNKISLNVSSILDVLKVGNSAEIHVFGDRIYSTRATLTELSEMLGDGFIMIHRGCLVSVMAIHDITDKINLSNGESLIYTKRKKNEILDLFHMKQIKPAGTDYKLDAYVCKKSLMLGITSLLSQLSLVAAMAAINNMLRKYGAMDAIFGQEQYAQIPMAVVGIVMKFFQIVISIVVGMAAGCIPIIGYNMGAEKKMRVQELFTKLLLAEALVGLAALVLAEGFPRQLIAIFGAANESSYYTDFAIKAFRIYLCLMVLACVNKACFIFLQAVGKALTSTLLSMFREVVFGVVFALLLPIFFGLDGVLYSMPVSDALTFVISAIIIAGTYRALNVESDAKC